MRRLLPLILLAALAAFFVPTAGAETHEGTFIIRGPTDHTRAADPIVSPGVFPSAHLHEFMCNSSTDENSTLESMLAATSSCEFSADTAGYWTAALLDPNGNAVHPRKMFAYYKTIPTPYRTTQPFPQDFRMVFGGVGHYPAHTFWDCFDHQPAGKYDHPLHCATDELQLRIIAPNCWDGFQLDTPNHRDHVVYPVSNACPADHPVKLPRITFFARYPQGSGGDGWVLADGNTIDHADFWSTWQPGAQEQLVRDCLNAGINCGIVRS